MVTPQFLPIPKAIHALACETISRRVDRLPFTRNDVEITEGIVGITLECLNAEVMRTLPLKTVARGTGTHPGLAECLSERRGSDQGGVAPVIAEVLVNAGLAEPAEVLDTATHTQIRGIRLLPAWTWHIGSGEFSRGGGQYTGGYDAWLARCPVCKTGILGRVTGKRLFGIPPTDFYFDCSHCGAKFTPEKDRFRLVSIARIADPRWRQYLNSSRTPDEWSALIREETPVRQAPSRIATSRYRMASRKPEAPHQTPPVRLRKNLYDRSKASRYLFPPSGTGRSSSPAPQKPSISGPSAYGFCAGHDMISSAKQSAPFGRHSTVRPLPG